MAAPGITARGTPAGIALKNGHSTKIAFSLLPTVSFWEREVGLPALEGGDPIDMTTMHNITVMTKAPPSLIDTEEVNIVARWDPNVYNQVLTSLLNREGTITEHFPDGSTLSYYGYLRRFEPQPMKINEPPEANLVIVPTNWDHVNKVEAVPLLTSVAGT